MVDEGWFCAAAFGARLVANVGARGRTDVEVFHGVGVVAVDGVGPEIKPVDFFVHSADVGELVGRFLAGSKDSLTVSNVAPLEDFDLDVSDAPLVHGGLRRLVEVDGVGAGEGPAVVVDDEMFSGVGDSEGGSRGPARPVSGCAMHFWTKLQIGSEGIFPAVGDVIGFGMGVGGGANGLKLCARDGALELRKGFGRLAGLQEEKNEWQEGECETATHSLSVD